MSGQEESRELQKDYNKLTGVLWLSVAFMACLSVFAINRAPLFYFDTPAYFSHGSELLNQLGLTTADLENIDEVAPDAPEAIADEEDLDEGGPEVLDDFVNGSRSAVYALLTTFVALGAGFSAMPFVNVGVLFLAIWLTVRVATRQDASALSPPATIALPIIVASLGSLPFYVAYIMPDIFTGVMIISVAAITIFGRSMKFWELMLVMVLGGFCAVSHISHIAIAFGMVPVAAVGAILTERRKFWLPPVLVAVMALAGFAERFAFDIAAETVAEAEVVYYPFLTARIIADGPGQIYLNAKCPNSEIMSCVLHEALSWSDDPDRFEATHIVFGKSEELGSFQLMTLEDQARVSDEQFEFFKDVFVAFPVTTSLALLKNTFSQLVRYSVVMTIADPELVDSLDENDDPNFDELRPGTLSETDKWLPATDAFHTSLYVATLVIVVLLLIGPHIVPSSTKLFVLVILLGVLANAFVCGAVSQPADRYGARVIWLLPFCATWMLMFSNLLRTSIRRR